MTIISVKRPDENRVEHKDIQDYELYRNISYLDIPKGNLARVRDSVQILQDLVSKDPMNRGKISLKLISKPRVYGTMMYLFNEINEHNFDLVHSHMENMGVQGALLKKYGCFDCPLVVSYHGFGNFFGVLDEDDGYDLIFEHSDKIIANSNYVREKLISVGAPADKLTLNYVGVDISRFEYVPPKTVSEPVKILSVGRLSGEKNYLTGIDIINNLIDSDHPFEIEYEIAGDGPQRDDLEARVEFHGINDNVRFLGEIDQTNVRDKMKNADVFLHPSRNEGLGKVLLESQATGLPIVASDVGGIPEAVDPGESALLNHPDDIAGFVHDLRNLIIDDGLRFSLAQRGRQYIVQHFENETVNDKLVEIYRSVDGESVVK